MLRATCVLLCTLLVLSHLNPTLARKSFTSGRHSYPKSNSGLSGSGGSRSHSYPKSGGGLSGNSGHGYPSSGGGLSGGGQSHSYPPAGGSPSHTYPSNTQSGSHGYPSSSGGLSGNSRPAATTQVHHHYHYSPPQSIQYPSARGAPPVSYPVYQGAPPSYVYQYKDSGSKYSNLLAGLALLNLGALAGAAIGSSTSHSSQSSSYKARPGEVCKFGIRKDNGDYEETRIDCQLISSFILQDEANKNSGPNNTVVTTTTVTNTTIVNTSNDAPAAAPAPEQPATVEAPKVTTYNMYENGTLVPVITEPVTVNETAAVANGTAAVTDTNAATNNTASSTSSVTVTTTTTVTNATDVKGPPVDVTPDMKCYVIRTSPSSNMKKTVPCGLLQTYADKSLKKNAGSAATATFSVLITCVFMVFTQY